MKVLRVSDTRLPIMEDFCCRREIQVLFVYPALSLCAAPGYSGRSRMVALRAAWAPITKTCAMSAVFEGPLINVP